MNKQLRRHLESLGLRRHADTQAAWRYYDALKGEKRRKAVALLNTRAEDDEESREGEEEEERNDDADSDEERMDEGAEDEERAEDDEEEREGEEDEEREGDDEEEESRRAPRLNTRSRRNGRGNGNRNANRDNGRVADPREAIRAERRRMNRVRDIAPEGVPEDLIRRAQSAGWSEARAGREYLRHIRESRQPAIEGAPFGHVSRRLEGNEAQRALAAGLMHRVSTPQETVLGAAFMARGAERRVRLTEQDADAGDRFRTLSLVDFCRHALQAEGRRVPSNRDDMIRSAVSTTSLSNIFTTSIHARLLGSYTEVSDTTDWCGSEDVANFQTQERASLGKSGAFDKLPRGGKAEHATLSDQKEEYKVARYAKQFVVDEQDFVDDNLNGIQQMPMELGNAAARLRPDLVYSILLANAALGADSIALFHSDHNNTDTNALNSANLGAGIVKMMQQTQDGVRLDLRPAFLIIPGDLGPTATDLLDPMARLIIAGTEDPSVKVPDSLKWIQSFALGLRLEGRIDANGVTDPNTGLAQTGSTTTWFLATNPGRTIIVGYLAGTGRVPQIRPFVLDRGQWGIGWDVKLDIGAKALDFRGLYRGNT